MGRLKAALIREYEDNPVSSLINKILIHIIEYRIRALCLLLFLIG